MTSAITVHALPAFADNYLWTLVSGDNAAVVDPGDGAVVQRFLESRSLRLRAILVTHHHGDHIGGIKALLGRWDVPVYGPRAERDSIGTLNVLLGDGDEIEVLGEQYEIFELPGHTAGHIAYYSAAADGGAGRIFCGDTLFSAGCGRLFEGTAAQMYDSLQRLAALPPTTSIYCTHEYTSANLAFARCVSPDCAAVLARSEQVRRLRAQDQPSVPSTIGAELRFNPFLRTADAQIRAAAQQHAGHVLPDETAVFAALREWKDSFRG